MEPQDILSSEDSVQRKNMSNTADNNVVTDSEMNAVSSSVDSPEVVCEAAPSDSEVVRADSVSGIYSREQIIDRKSTRLNSSHSRASRMPSSA